MPTDVLSAADLDLDLRPVDFAAPDGVTLSGRWLRPHPDAPAARAVVVVVCGAGIPARFYERLARYLAHAGAAALTFDYRGIGASRRGALRGIDAGMDVWALRDIEAALTTARAQYPALPLCAVAHSVGTLLLGAAPTASRVSRCVFLGAHTGYWRDYHAKWRPLLYAVWHGFMPAVTRVVGYFPGRALGLGEDMPRQVAYDWAGRRRPELVRTERDAQRFGPHLGRYGEFRAPTLSVSITDDAFAPPEAAERLLAMYPSLDAKREAVTPASLGARRLGHFGFIRRAHGEAFWRRTAEWLFGSG